jgi:hypothetical protein
LKAAGAVAIAIVEIERDFGGVAGGTIAGAGKDHVVHAGRAHVLVGILPHHPAQRFDQIGLAAAIRPDNTGQPALDDEFGGFDEGLETEKAEFGEFHAICPLFSPAGRRWPEGPDEGVDARPGFPLIASRCSALLPAGEKKERKTGALRRPPVVLSKRWGSEH